MQKDMLDDYPRQQLHQLIRQFGHEVLDNPKRCAAILRDFCPAHKREVNLLLAALQERAVADLLQAGASVPREQHIHRLAMRLHDNQGIAEPFALWAVKSWALALELVSQPLHKQDEMTASLTLNQAANRAQAHGIEKDTTSGHISNRVFPNKPKGTATFTGNCTYCGSSFTVTMTRHDSGARCPECFRMNDASEFQRREFIF